MAATGVVAAAIAAFVPALSPDFVNWDDPGVLLDNPHYRGLGPRQLAWMFTTFHMGHYMPLTWLTLGWDYVMWEMSAWGYHLDNLLLHAGTALIFYFLALRLLRLALRPPPPLPNPLSLRGGGGEGGDASIRLPLAAASAALFFAVHPLRAESVAWITERRDVLSGLFYVAAALAYVKAVSEGPRRVGLFWGSVALFVCALLSKSLTVTLPATLLVLDIYPLRRLGGAAGWGRWHVWAEKLPFFVLAVAAAAVAFLALLPLGNARSLAEMSPLVRLVLVLYSQAFYLVKTVWPAALSPLYGFPVDVTYVHLGLAVAGNLLALAALRFAPALSATWAVYTLTLLPASGLFHNGPQAVADRYSYLACLPWALWVGAAAAWRPRRAPALRAVALAFRTLVVAALLGLGALTWSQAGIWHDSIALWTHALAVNPDSRDAHGYLGKAYDEAGLVAEAVAHYAEAARRSRNRLPWYVLIARVLEDDGNDQGAMAYYGEVLRSAPGSAEACAGLRRIGGHMELPPEMLASCPTGG
jgi:tetratricopeptide (TPR) repeat protein